MKIQLQKNMTHWRRWPGENALPSSPTKSNSDLATIQMPKEQQESTVYPNVQNFAILPVKRENASFNLPHCFSTNI